MSRFKKLLLLLLAVGITLSIAACSDNGSTEFESTQSFEFHFNPGEIEAVLSKTFTSIYESSPFLLADFDIAKNLLYSS